MIYQQYVHPFLRQHEHDIDDFISSSHEKAKAAGLQYLKQLIEYVRVNVLGLPPQPPSPPPAPQSSYAQSLFARFTLPSVAGTAGAGGRPNIVPVAPSGTGGDWFGILGGALQSLGAASGKSREAQAEDLAASGTLIPRNLQSNEERLSYIAKQRDSLGVLLQAFDREAYNLSSTPSTPGDHIRSASSASGRGSDSNLSKSRSELDFDKIEFEGEANMGKATPGSTGGWAPWSWGGKPGVDDGKKEQ